MMSDGSVTRWICEFKRGDDQAAQKLWERYYERLLYQCRRKLGNQPRRVADEEDVALTAFNNLLLAIEQNRYPRLCDRDNLWRLLVVIADREASHQKEYDNRKKRGEGRVQTEAVVDDDGTSCGEANFDHIIGKEPTPEFAAIMAEQVERLLARLGNDKLRQIAQMKMEGYKNEEIARHVGYSLRDLERKLQSIRSDWSPPS